MDGPSPFKEVLIYFVVLLLGSSAAISLLLAPDWHCNVAIEQQ